MVRQNVYENKIMAVKIMSDRWKISVFCLNQQLLHMFIKIIIIIIFKCWINKADNNVLHSYVGLQTNGAYRCEFFPVDRTYKKTLFLWFLLKVKIVAYIFRINDVHGRGIYELNKKWTIRTATAEFLRVNDINLMLRCLFKLFFSNETWKN